MSYEVEISSTTGTDTIIVCDCYDSDDCISKVHQSHPDATIEFVGVL